MSHRKAVWVMVAAALMWSIAGVVSRFLESAARFELTFWRGAFTVLALVVLLSYLRGPATLWLQLRQGGRALWLSGVCWAVMFTAFMVALTLTSVANVLVTLALGPLFTALASRLVLGHQLASRTWAAIALAGVALPGCTAMRSTPATRAASWAWAWRCVCRWLRPSIGPCCSI